MEYSECESGWLIVENDLSTRLTRPEQLRYALQCMGRNPSDKAVERYWSQCGGSMSYDQFCFVMQREKRTTMSDLMKSFRKIDINGDGYITAKELHRMLTKRGEKMSHDEVQAIIDEADKNGDGKLDYAEFCHMLLNTSEQCVQASRQKAKRLGHRQPPPGQANSRQRGEQVKFQQQRGSKYRSSSHRRGGGGQERKERRREEIHSQLYPTTTAEDQRGGEPHLLYRRHHRSSGIENSRDGGDHFHHHDYQNGFREEPTNGRVAHRPASFSQVAVSGGGPFHNMPAASYTEQPKPLSQPLAVQSQGLEQQQQSLTQATEPASSSTVEASTVTKTAEAKDDSIAAEVERDPAALQEKRDGVKQVKDSSVTDKKEEIQPKPHSQASVSEKPLQERKEETEIAKKEGEHTGPLDEKPTTEPHPPVAKTETSIEKEPTPSLPSKPDLNNEAESLASVVPSSEQISDPLALPSSSSLPKLPPLKKSLPPLLPPIGAATPTTAVAGQSVKKTEQPETKLSENAALSSKRDVKGGKEGSDHGEGGSSSAGAADTQKGSREGGGDTKREIKVEKKGSDNEEGDGSSAIAAATHIGVESPDVGKGSPKEQVRDDAEQQVRESTDRKGGGESSDGTTESQELKIKDGSSAAATKVGASGSDKGSDRQQTQMESQGGPQSEASPAKKKEKVNDTEEEVKDKKQTDHLDRGSGEGDGEEGEGEKQGGKGEEEGKGTEGERKGKKATASAPMSVITPPPRQPRNLKAWNNINGKGCFYLEVEEGEGSSPQEVGVVIHCHQYRLSLPSPTNVWIEMGVARPGIQATDVLLFVFHTDKDDEPTELVTYTQHKVGEHWISRLDLDAGTYALIPFTSGCHLKPREEEDSPVPHLKAAPLIEEREGGKVELTEGCVEALKEVFHRIDLDGNGFISRMEFDFFQEMTSGESCDDDAWKAIQDNFELNGDDEITLKGFLDLHVMTAEDEEGGEGEVWDILNTMGYNKQLQLDQACPFTLEVFTEDCEGEIEIVDLLPFNPVVNPALCRLVMERGVSEEVRDGGGDLLMYTFTTPHLTTIAVENKGSKKASMQLDCSRSTNFVPSRDSSVCVLPLQPNSTAVGIHLLPKNADEPYTVDCIATKILC